MKQNDLQKCLDIKPGQLWLRRDGGKARIYANDGSPPFVIHGAFEGTDGQWGAESWTSAGGVCSEINDPYDLIRRYDWREELAPVWAVLKPEYRWVAMNASGQWLAFALRNRPARAESVFWSQGENFPLHALRMPAPECPWNETLTERPDE